MKYINLYIHVEVNMSSWNCPFCGHLSVFEKIQKKNNDFSINAETKYGALVFESWVNVCPNPECKEFTYASRVSSAELIGGYYRPTKEIETWINRPNGRFKQFPDYVPTPILTDYKEAVLIKELSPKASATLSRRCLQGMIRNVWNVKPARLVDEIRAIEGLVEASMWKAIDAVRNIGNIGAHMENDINVIVDVEPGEADMLIGLLELLIQEWYVEKHERQLRVEAITALAAEKKAQKNAK
jgi:rubredoxin